MHQKTKEIQKRFEGFLRTPYLWENSSVYNLRQFKIDTKFAKIEIQMNHKLRLGKYIERLVSFQMSLEKDIHIICENVQIQKDKITLGELDCILKKEQSYIHLEIIYKFYLYDKSVGITEIEHCIGPNRKDSLLEKLVKLKNKQLPLLYSKECVKFLSTINLKPSEIEQQVYFKAQLFVPFTNRNPNFINLNQNCICGFYINRTELYQFTGCKFYIPNKKDWIITPEKNVDWLNFDAFQSTVKSYFSRKFSPLCWIKKDNGEIEKFFLVWW